jgi:hypothetical protein
VAIEGIRGPPARSGRPVATVSSCRGEVGSAGSVMSRGAGGASTIGTLPVSRHHLFRPGARRHRASRRTARAQARARCHLFATRKGSFRNSIGRLSKFGPPTLVPTSASRHRRRCAAGSEAWDRPRLGSSRQRIASTNGSAEEETRVESSDPWPEESPLRIPGSSCGCMGIPTTLGVARCFGKSAASGPAGVLRVAGRHRKSKSRVEVVIKGGAASIDRRRFDYIKPATASRHKDKAVGVGARGQEASRMWNSSNRR